MGTTRLTTTTIATSMTATSPKGILLSSKHTRLPEVKSPNRDPKKANVQQQRGQNTTSSHVMANTSDFAQTVLSDSEESHPKH